MTPNTLTGVVHRLRVAVDPAAPQRSDADLVRAVARLRDPAAFADVVHRHGPMVLGTCRRVLRDAVDADDAFQATFLVFLRRAASLRRPERLAGWLFQVAYRTSRKLRTVRAARRGRETELFDIPVGEPPAEFVWRELRPIFDAELDRLPDRLRLPAVLCLLEGRSKRDAAKTLGWPEGTVAGRLQQARETLRRRFTARGLTLSAGALAVALFEGAGAAAVPPALLASTIYGLAAGSASAGASALADGVLHAMFVTKVKAITAVVLLTGIVGTGTGIVVTPGPGPGLARADGPATEKGPAPRAVETAWLDDVPEDQVERLLKEHVELRRALDKQREVAVLADLQAKNLQQKNMNLLKQVEALTVRIRELEQPGEAKPAQPAPPGVRGKVTHISLAPGFAQINLGSDTGLSVGHVLTVFFGSDYKGDLRITAVDPKSAVGKFSPVRRGVEIQKDDSVSTTVRSAEADKRALLEADVAQLRDRKTFAEQMVKKGFMTQAQLAADTARLAEAEARLAKLDPAQPKGPTVADKLIAELIETRREKLTREVERLREDRKRVEEELKKGLVAQADVDAAMVRLMQAEIMLRMIPPLPTVDPRRATLEDRLQRLSAILKAAEAPNVDVSEAELIQARLRVLQTRFELLGLDAASDTKKAGEQKEIRDQAQTLLGRLVSNSEAGLRAGHVPQVEVRQVRARAAETAAEMAFAMGELDAALRHSEAVVKELEAVAETAKAMRDRHSVSATEVRAALIALADAKANVHRIGLRKQLADIVTLREAEVNTLKSVATKVSKEDIQKAEAALAEARAKLSEGK